MSKQKTTDRVYDYIVEYGNKNGYAPSMREIADDLGISSPSTIFYHINKLTEDGRIKKDSSKNRTLSASNRKVVEYTDIPLIGNVAAGVPILAVENIADNLSLPSSLFGGSELFSLKIKGDSMKNAGINDGDIIIVNKQSDAENGEIVVAMVDDEATVKRLYKEKNAIILKPENENYEPIVSSDVTILGKVIGLLRRI